MRIIAAIALGIIAAASGVVNAADAPLTEKQPSRPERIARLAKAVHAAGSAAPLALGAERHGLKPGVPIKYFHAKPGADAYRLCDLLYKDHDAKDPATLDSLLLFHKSQSGRKILLTDFRFGLDGRLISAARSEGRVDEKGRPVKGSLKVETLDLREKAVLAEANAALDYWLDGAYKPHLVKDGATQDSTKKPSPAAK